MKNIEIKKIFEKYLKDYIPNNYNLKGNIIYKQPINDLLIGFCFERTGLQQTGFYLNVFVQPLYVPTENLMLTFGYRIRFNGNDFWEIDAAKDNTQLFFELRTAINKHIIGFLNIFDSAKNFYRYYQDKCENLRMVEAVVLSAIFDLSEERYELMDKYLSILKNEDLSVNWKRTLLENAIMLNTNISNETVVKEILLDWKNETKKKLKL